MSASPIKSQARFKKVLVQTFEDKNTQVDDDEVVFKVPQVCPRKRLRSSDGQSSPSRENRPVRAKRDGRNLSLSTSQSVENQMPFPDEILEVNNVTTMQETLEANKDENGMPISMAPHPSLYKSAKSMTNWTVRLYKRRLVVEGTLLDFTGDFDPDDFNPDTALWKSSKVVKIKSSKIICTCSSEYYLEGKLHLQRAHEYDTPGFIVKAFFDGFPSNWEMFAHQWREFHIQQSSNVSCAASAFDESCYQFPSIKAVPKETLSATQETASRSRSRSGGRKASLPTKDIGKKESKCSNTGTKSSRVAKSTMNSRNQKGKGEMVSVANSKKPTNNSGKSKKGRILKEKVAKSRKKSNEKIPVIEKSKCLKIIPKHKKTRNARVSKARKTATESPKLTRKSNRAPSITRKSSTTTNKSIAKSHQSQASLKTLTKKTLADAKKSSSKDEKSKSKTRKKSVSTAQQKAEAEITKTTVDGIVANPKTLRDRRKNEAFMKKLNLDHADNIFQSAKKHESKKKIKTPGEKQGPQDIIRDLFDSDSENDISLHSAKTPITNFLSRSFGLRSPAMELDSRSISDLDDRLKLAEGVIKRQVKDYKKMSKEGDKTLSKDNVKAVTSRIDTTVLPLLQDVSNDIRKKKEALEDSDSDMSSHDHSSILDVPTGLWERYGAEVGFLRK